jgi:WD repeat-containing protein 48
MTEVSRRAACVSIVDIANESTLCTVNLGKWVLANLFAGLIKVEADEVAKQEQSKPSADASALSGTSSQPTLQRGSAPTYIALDGNTGHAARQRLRSQPLSSGNDPMTPGGLMVGLATPAATPAIVPSGSNQEDTGPNLDSWVTRGRTNGHLGINTLSTIPQSPAVASPTPVAFSPSAAKSPKGDPSNGKDYFSFPSKKSRGTTPGPIVTKDTSPTRRPDSAALVTPGGSQASFMGKFKGFGGKNKKPLDTPATPNGSNAVSLATDDATAAQTAKPDGKDVEQLQGLDEIRSQPFHPPYYSDAPPFDFPENTAVSISETSQSAGAWAVIYRSMVSKVERNPQALETAAPTWLLDYLFTGRTKTVEAKKLTFLLEPWPDAEEADRLPPLPPR